MPKDSQIELLRGVKDDGNNDNEVSSDWVMRENSDIFVGGAHLIGMPEHFV